MWPESNNPSIEPPEVKPMPGRPGRCRRKQKDEPRKKYGKLSKKGVKMTCSRCHQLGHNKSACKSVVIVTLYSIINFRNYFAFIFLDLFERS